MSRSFKSFIKIFPSPILLILSSSDRATSNVVSLSVKILTTLDGSPKSWSFKNSIKISSSSIFSMRSSICVIVPTFWALAYLMAFPFFHLRYVFNTGTYSFCLFSISLYKSLLDLYSDCIPSCDNSSPPCSYRLLKLGSGFFNFVSSSIFLMRSSICVIVPTFWALAYLMALLAFNLTRVCNTDIYSSCFFSPSRNNSLLDLYGDCIPSCDNSSPPCPYCLLKLGSGLFDSSCNAIISLLNCCSSLSDLPTPLSLNSV